ncbi:MAG: ribosome-associated translation inhibitor RaiA [Candidatus Jidaibacter sp.]|jgi:ribosomal subunit interface protein|nr:ribosome-associated translation inhibitor RaiA [Candidatus Jidaibacter sp.]
MKVIVSGQHMDVGDSLRSHIQEHVEKHVSKYFENAISSSVMLTMEKPHYIRTDVLVNEGTGKGILVKSTAHDSDAYRSFDSALVKLENQMRKHKSRLKNHQRINPDKLSFIEAKKYVISPSNDTEDYGDSPAIIAEKLTSIEELPVGDAVMKMDLMGASTYLFINSGTKRLNVLYYRRDGNIAWIDVPPIG